MEEIAKMREEIEDLKTLIDLLTDKIKELEEDLIKYYSKVEE